MIASLLFNLAYRRFRSACRDPLAAQAKRLRIILRQAKRSELGQQLDFDAIARIKGPVAMIRAFQDRVPVRNYAEMRADLDAVYAGDWQRLCPSEPIWFAMTAGSTGRFKYVPVTAEFRREIGQASMIFNGALESAYPALRGLKAQFLVGSAEGGHSPAGIAQGFASGFNYKNLPGMVRRRFVLPYWVFTIDDAEERAYAAGRMLAGERDLGALCAISPVNLINLRQALERHAERLCDDIEHGTLAVRGSSAVAGTFRGRPDAARAAALRESLRRDGALPSKLLFPSLQVLVCWQGGNMSYYLPELHRAFGVDRHFEFPISASEGVFAVPCDDRAGGALAVTSHFLEFLPDEPGSATDARALRADELEVGAHYRVVVTNSGGFYRYDMEDVVRVREFLHRTPVIEFVSKKDRQVSVSNERITERDVTVAMQAASSRCGVWFPEFLFVPCSDRRYRVMVDGAAVEETRMQDVAALLEHELRGAAKGYDFEREDALLEPLQLVVTARGELSEYMRRRQGDQSLPNAQVKPVHLTSQFNAHRAFTATRTYAA